MNLIEEIIRSEIKLFLLERNIDIPLSIFNPDFSCKCEPDELGRMYVLDYILPSPVRGIKGIIAFINNNDDYYRIETVPMKLIGGGLGPRQYAVYNSLKRKVYDYYKEGLLSSGWAEEATEDKSPFFIPPWSS